MKYKIEKKFDFGSDQNKKSCALNFIILSDNWLNIETHLRKYPNEINHNWPNAGGTPLHIVLAMEKWQRAIQVLDVISSIEKNKKELILDFTIIDRELKTLLIIAAKLRQWEFIRYLFEKFPRIISIIDKQDEHGRTALHYAALYGDLSTVQFLIRQGANTKLVDTSGNTALGSVKQDSKVVAKTLVSIEVHPDRSCSAPLNEIMKNVENSMVISYSFKAIENAKSFVANRKEINKFLYSHDKKLMLSPQAAAELIERFEKCLKILNNERILATQENLAVTTEYAYFFVGLEMHSFLKTLTYDERSVLDVCMKGQEQILRYFSKTPMYEIASNETVRISANVRKKFAILSAGLGDNQIAIILRDALGNMSVTVVSDEKELQRIPDEAKALPGELASLDIITKTGSEMGLAKKALSLYEQIQVQNSKKTKEVRTTKTGVILLAEDRMLAPDEKQVTQFKSSSETLSDKHPLVNYRPTLCRSNASDNIHELIGEVAGVIEKRSVQPVQNMVGSTPLSIPEVSSTFFAGSVVPGNMVVTPGSSGGPPIGVNGMAKSADF